MRSTLGQLKDFKESVIWADIVEELQIWLDQIRDGLENPGMQVEHRMLDRLGGCAEAIRNFSNIMDVLVALVEDDQGERSTVLNKLIKGRKEDD